MLTNFFDNTIAFCRSLSPIKLLQTSSFGLQTHMVIFHCEVVISFRPIPNFTWLGCYIKTWVRIFMEDEDTRKAKPDALKNCLGHSPNQRHTQQKEASRLKQTCPVSYVIKQWNRSTTSVSCPYTTISFGLSPWPILCSSLTHLVQWLQVTW